MENLHKISAITAPTRGPRVEGLRHVRDRRLMDAAVAAELLELARRVRRISPPLRLNPHRFHEERDDAAHAIEALVRRHCPSALPPCRDRRAIRTVVTTIAVGSRRVMVQRRAAFALG